MSIEGSSNTSSSSYNKLPTTSATMAPTPSNNDDSTSKHRRQPNFRIGLSLDNPVGSDGSMSPPSSSDKKSSTTPPATASAYSNNNNSNNNNNKFRRHPNDKMRLSLDRVGPSAHFPWKLHHLLRSCQGNDQESIISWLPDRKSFQVHDRHRFTSEVMPKFFNTSNYRSFQRNLSLWGFKTSIRGPNKGVISHVDFVQDDIERCCRIQRHALASGHDNSDNKNYDDSESSSRPSSAIVKGETSTRSTSKSTTTGAAAAAAAAVHGPVAAPTTSMQGTYQYNDDNNNNTQLNYNNFSDSNCASEHSIPTVSTESFGAAPAPGHPQGQPILDNSAFSFLSGAAVPPSTASTNTTSSGTPPSIASLIALANLVQPNDAESLVRNMLLQIVLNSLKPAANGQPGVAGLSSPSISVLQAVLSQTMQGSAPTTTTTATTAELSQEHYQQQVVHDQQQQQQQQPQTPLQQYQQQQQQFIPQDSSTPSGVDSTSHANAIAVLQAILSSTTSTSIPPPPPQT